MKKIAADRNYRNLKRAMVPDTSEPTLGETTLREEEGGPRDPDVEKLIKDIGEMWGYLLAQGWDGKNNTVTAPSLENDGIRNIELRKGKSTIEVQLAWNENPWRPTQNVQLRPDDGQHVGRKTRIDPDYYKAREGDWGPVYD